MKLIKIRISDSAKKVIEQTAEVEGMTELSVASRLVEWFGRQDDVMKKWVLGHYAGLESEAARLALERITAGKTKAK